MLNGFLHFILLLYWASIWYLPSFFKNFCPHRLVIVLLFCKESWLLYQLFLQSPTDGRPNGRKKSRIYGFKGLFLLVIILGAQFTPPVIGPVLPVVPPWSIIAVPKEGDGIPAQDSRPQHLVVFLYLTHKAKFPILRSQKSDVLSPHLTGWFADNSFDQECLKFTITFSVG